MVRNAKSFMYVGHVLRQGNLESSIWHHRMTTHQAGLSKASRDYSGDVIWTAADFIRAHEAVKESGRFNFDGCRIPIPTPIRYDRIREALGDEVSSKEQRVLSLLKYGMPIDCKPGFGVRRKQKNHFSAVSFKEAINDYLYKNVQCQALLGPFNISPIPDLCFSPLMFVPKEGAKLRVIVDFSFPPGQSPGPLTRNSK